MNGTFERNILAMILILIVLAGCGQVASRAIEVPLFFSILTDPPEAKLYYRLASSTDKVNSGNRQYLGRSPYRQAVNLKSFGLDNEGAERISLVLEIEKSGYYNRVEKLDLLDILTVGELSVLHHLNKKEAKDEELGILFPPGDFRASTGTYIEYVKLNWTKVEGVSGYYVYRDTDINGSFNEKIATVSGEEFLDRVAEPNQKYFYRAKSFNNKGESDFSGICLGYIGSEKASKDDKGNKKDDKTSSETPSANQGDGVTLPNVPSLGNLPTTSLPNIPKAPSTSGVPPVMPIVTPGAVPPASGVEKKIKKIKKIISG